MSDLVSSRSWAAWLPAFLRAKPAPAPLPALTLPPEDAPAADVPTIGLVQGPPPTGPRQGSLVVVSCYQPFGTNIGPLVTALATLGYVSLEVRVAKHDATKSRVTAQARIPVLDVHADQVRAAIRQHVTPSRIDVAVWPTY